MTWQSLEKIEGDLGLLSTLSTSMFPCLGGTWEEEISNQVVCFGAQATVPPLAWTVWMQQHAQLWGSMQHACMSCGTPDSLGKVGFCHLCAPKKLLCPLFRAPALLPLLEKVSVSHGAFDGWISSQWIQTRSAIISFCCWRSLLLIADVPQNGFVPDVIFLPRANNPIDSNGYIPLDVTPSIPSATIICFAARSQIQLSCAFLLSLLNDMLLPWWALICE